MDPETVSISLRTRKRISIEKNVNVSLLFKSENSTRSIEINLVGSFIWVWKDF